MPTCASCGRGGDGLKTCTACKQVKYCNVQCQKAHRPKHKAECRRIAAAQKANNKPPARKQLVECRWSEEKGRSLFATSPLPAGCHPLSKVKGDEGLSEPFAHPVLIESMRQLRCAYCFSLIHNRQSNASTVEFHHHCSPRCQRLDKNWMAETHAVQHLPSPPSPTALSCSRILRKFKETPESVTEYNQLCYNIDNLTQEEKDSYTAVMTQCHAFLRAMEDSATAKMAHDMMHPDPSPAYQFMSRLSMNGFTISNSEQLPIGHGVYCGASMINHSCRPNAVPTFWLRTFAIPMLQITTVSSVNVGEEVTISYCDASPPLCIRRECLKNYKFVCDCPLCKDLERDDEVVGLKCTSDGCKGKVKSISVPLNNYCIPGDGESMQQKYQCTLCQCTNFDNALKAQADSINSMKRLESAMNNNKGNMRHQGKIGEESEQIYERLKRHCVLQKSYYSAWSADLFVSWSANALNSCCNEQEQLDLCRQALVVINESRAAARFCMDYPSNLPYHVKRGIEAKLRLFVNPMDMEALEMLRNVRNGLLAYYPSSDDMILSLDESLAAYSFS